MYPNKEEYNNVLIGKYPVLKDTVGFVSDYDVTINSRAHGRWESGKR